MKMAGCVNDSHASSVEFNAAYFLWACNYSHDTSHSMTQSLLLKKVSVSGNPLALFLFFPSLWISFREHSTRSAMAGL